MTVKIYHGYLLAPTLHMGNVLQWASQIRPQLAEVAHRTLALDLFERATSIVDLAVLKAAGLLHTPGERGQVEVPALQYANAKQTEDRKEIQKGHRKPGVDVNVSVTVVPHATGLYALLDSDNEHTTKAFRKLPDVRHFPYSNATDAPEGLTQEAWDARGDLWRDILGPRLKPSDNGASVVLVDLPFGLMAHEMPTLDELNDAWLPAFTERVFEATLLTTAGEVSDAIREDLNKGQFGSFMAHQRRLRSGEMPGFERMRSRVEALLPRTYPRAWLDMVPIYLEAATQAHVRAMALAP